MPSDKTAPAENRVYNLRFLPNCESRMHLRHRPYTKNKPAKGRKKSAKCKQKQSHSTEDKMIQTSGGDALDSEYARPSSHNDVYFGNEPELRTVSPIPNLSEGDISSLLGILNSTNSASSTSATPIQTSAVMNTPSSRPQCASRLHCLGCSCTRATPWCSAHACALCPDLAATGCRSAALHPPTLCTGGCLCSGLFRHTLCSAQDPHGPAA